MTIYMCIYTFPLTSFLGGRCPVSPADCSKACLPWRAMGSTLPTPLGARQLHTGGALQLYMRVVCSCLRGVFSFGSRLRSVASDCLGPHGHVTYISHSHLQAHSDLPRGSCNTLTKIKKERKEQRDHDLIAVLHEPWAAITSWGQWDPTTCTHLWLKNSHCHGGAPLVLQLLNQRQHRSRHISRHTMGPLVSAVLTKECAKNGRRTGGNDHRSTSTSGALDLGLSPAHTHSSRSLLNDCACAASTHRQQCTGCSCWLLW